MILHRSQPGCKGAYCVSVCVCMCERDSWLRELPSPFLPPVSASCSWRVEEKGDVPVLAGVAETAQPPHPRP